MQWKRAHIVRGPSHKKITMMFFKSIHGPKWNLKDLEYECVYGLPLSTIVQKYSAIFPSKNRGSIYYIKDWIIYKWIVGKNLGWSTNCWPCQPKFYSTFSLQSTFSSNSLVHDPGPNILLLRVLVWNWAIKNAFGDFFVHIFGATRWM